MDMGRALSWGQCPRGGRHPVYTQVATRAGHVAFRYARVDFIVVANAWPTMIVCARAISMHARGVDYVVWGCSHSMARHVAATHQPNT